MTDAKPTPNDRQIRSSDITPPPELVEQWMQEHATKYDLARHAAQWGANERTQAICGWLDEPSQQSQQAAHLIIPLLAHFYPLPKPPSLAQEALEALDYSLEYDVSSKYELIRRALERLQELEGAS